MKQHAPAVLTSIAFATVVSGCFGIMSGYTPTSVWERTDPVTKRTFVEATAKVSGVSSPHHGSDKDFTLELAAEKGASEASLTVVELVAVDRLRSAAASAGCHAIEVAVAGAPLPRSEARFHEVGGINQYVSLGGRITLSMSDLTRLANADESQISLCRAVMTLDEDAKRVLKAFAGRVRGAATVAAAK